MTDRLSCFSAALAKTTNERRIQPPRWLPQTVVHDEERLSLQELGKHYLHQPTRLELGRLGLREDLVEGPVQVPYHTPSWKAPHLNTMPLSSNEHS